MALGKTVKQILLPFLMAFQLHSHLMIQSLILTGELSHRTHVHSDAVVFLKSYFYKFLSFVSFKPTVQQIVLPGTNNYMTHSEIFVFLISRKISRYPSPTVSVLAGLSSCTPLLKLPMRNPPSLRGLVSSL